MPQEDTPPEGQTQDLPEPTRLESPDALCPWCNEAQSDTWEHYLSDGQTVDTLCEECEEPIRIEAHVWVDYTTHARVEAKGARS